MRGPPDACWQTGCRTTRPVGDLVEAGPDLDGGDLRGPLGGPDFLAALDVPDADLPLARGDPSDRRRAASAYPRGRGMGGSSTVNAMVALHGDPELYRSWGWDDARRGMGGGRASHEQVDDAELGAVDRALLAAAPDAERAD